jgi:RimJ/RimL family protein N-acetyltransferase
MTPPVLTLRPLQAGDCDRLLGWIDSEDALYQWSGARSFSWPLDRGQLLRDLAAQAGGSRELLAAVDDDGEMVGHVSVDANRHHRVANIGRVAIAPDKRGGGLGAALMHATVSHGFETLGMHRMQLNVYTFNTAAIACYRSVGFVVEGVARDSTRGSDGYWDGLAMSLLVTDYRRPLRLGDGVRIAGPRDAEAIAALLTDLGYPHTHEAAAATLLAWAAESQGEVLVAEDLGGAVAGFAAVHRIPHFGSPGAFARLVALSVDARHRRAGVGRRLMAAVERWATAHGCVDVEVTSLRSRDAAHGFYAALGYEDRCAASGRFTRALAADPGA